jgi:hypothetical protein
MYALLLDPIFSHAKDEINERVHCVVVLLLRLAPWSCATGAARARLKFPK